MSETRQWAGGCCGYSSIMLTTTDPLTTTATRPSLKITKAA